MKHSVSPWGQPWVQSPVVLIEFDHHIGVFLTNPEPAKFHVHTIVRTPNGNDYGLDLLRLHYQQAPQAAHRCADRWSPELRCAS